MRKLATLALIALSVFAFASTSVAQAEPGDLGIFFDAAGNTTTKVIPGFTIDFFYVLGFQLGPITGWEAGITWTDPTWNILGTTLNPGTALNVGGVGNFIVGLGACVDAGAVHLLVTYQVGYFVAPVAPSDVIVCTGPASPSSFGGLPGYSSCADELIPFGAAQNGQGAYPNGCGVINPTNIGPIGTSSESFGAVKAKF